MNANTKTLLRSLAKKTATIDRLKAEIDTHEKAIKKIMKQIEVEYPPVPREVIVKIDDKHRMLIFDKNRRYIESSFDMGVIHGR